MVAAHSDQTAITYLRPHLTNAQGKPCRREDRNGILKSLGGTGVDPSRVTQVCIQEELEAWLIADGRALTTVLSTATHPKKISHEKCAETFPNPKKHLNKLLSQSRHRQYVDFQHAIMIVNAMPDLNRLYKLDTFLRFADKFEAE
jgi:hypothetical protein